MGIRIGIDLGTSNSSVAYIDSATSKATVMKNRYDMTITPSVLAFLEDGTVLYGEDAKELQSQGFENTISFFKRYMGNDNYEVEFFGKVYSAVDLSAIFLRKLVEEAETQLGNSVEEVVITVPAYFKHKERMATMEAARLAGLKVKQIMNEPTAAALSYGIHGKQTEQTLLVYDLGGGTFDVTIAKVSKDTVSVIGIDGNHRLGGKEWDDAIARWALQQYNRQFTTEILEQDGLITKLLIDAEIAKKQLSVASSTTFSIGSGENKVSYLLTQRIFQEITQSLLELTSDCIKRLFRHSGMSWSEISGIILVGGATRMKMVREYLETITTVPILLGINPMEAVALGAAISANTVEKILPVVSEFLLGKKSVIEPSMEPEYKLLAVKKVEEVIAHSLGMISINERGDRYINSIIIKKNSRIPASETKPFVYYTKSEGNELEVYLVQGEEIDPLKCQIVGKYVFSNIACLPGSKSVIDVTYSYNRNGMIEVEATQREIHRKLEMRMEQVPEDLDWIRTNPEEAKQEEKVPEQRVIYVAIDLSGSMKGRPLVTAKNAIYHFVHELNLNFCKVGIIGFADRVKLILPPTNKLSVLESMIRGISLNYRELGYCNDSDPFYLIYDEFEKLAMEENVTIKNAIVLTDGMWTHPDRAIAASKKCHMADIDVIALGFGQARTGFLRQIASGVNLAKFTELEELKIQFSKIAQEMR